jgi:hypothetical protein
MKILKAKQSHPKKKILKISDLNYIKYYEQNNIYLQDLSKDFEMIEPIEINQHTISENQRYGANGMLYIEKNYSVVKGNQRVTIAKKLGYTHIEGIVLNERT